MRKWTWNACSPDVYDKQRCLSAISTICDKAANGYLKPRTSPHWPYWGGTEWEEEDWDEIESVESEKLRLLYAILYRHCKLLGDRCGRFYMSYAQMSAAGADKNRSRLKVQIEQLTALVKIEIVQTNCTLKKKKNKAPNVYRMAHCVRRVT